MRLPNRVLALCFGLVTFWCCTDASASVSLSFTNGTGSPTSATVIRGTTFAFTIDLHSTTSATADQVTAVDYFLAASTTNIFTISARNTTTDGTSFPQTYDTDAGVVSAGNNPMLNIAASPNFRNGEDLGGGVTNINAPISNTTVVVADYSVLVAANAPTGTYTLTTFSQPGTGYAGPGPTFPDTTFASQGIYTVTITTPEPSTLTLIGLGVAGFSLRRRRNA